MKDLQKKLKLIPGRPGVYVFKGDAGKVVYVGKAKSLKKRVSSYFSGTPDSIKTSFLLKNIRDIEYIITHSELEALILENNLIKKYRPRYNVILKDDKQYPYLKLTMKEEWPRLLLVRRVLDDGARYFGPMTGSAARETIKLIRRLFPIRMCKETPLKKRRQPCMYYHIGKCLGPCVEPISKETYLNLCMGIIALLEGRIDRTIGAIRKEMEDASEDLDFERAKMLRDRLFKLEKMKSAQKVVSPDLKDRDVFVVSRTGGSACALVFHVRQGKLVGRDFFFLREVSWTFDSEILEQALIQYYKDAAEIPPEVLLERSFPGLPAVIGLLKHSTGKKTSVKTSGNDPLVKTAKDNARMLLERNVLSEAKIDAAALEGLRQKLGLKIIPIRIEAFDVSHIAGDMAVASMVVFSGGRPDKSAYRKFTVRSGKGNDDTASLYEVIKRRFSPENKLKMGLPDLVLVDGGIGQARAASRALKETNSKDIAVISLAKKFEDIYLPSSSKPVRIPRTSKALMLLQRARDEAHRFAAAFHRASRTKKMLLSELDGVKGVGPILKKRLIASFGDMDGIRAASLSDIMNVRGVTRAIARRLTDKFSRPDKDRTPIFIEKKAK